MTNLIFDSVVTGRPSVIHVPESEQITSHVLYQLVAEKEVSLKQSNGCFRY